MTVKRSFRTPLVFSFLILLGGVLLFSVPFGLALEVHHLFSEVDHDGHEHDTYDLCTWVEHHSGGTYVQDGFFAGPTLEIRNFSCHLFTSGYIP